MNSLPRISCLVCLLLPFGIASDPEKATEVYVQIITVKTQAELDHALRLLREGQDFSEVARNYSNHSTAATGGTWGPLRLDDLPLEVARQIENAGEGILVQFFHPNLGFVILRRLDALAVNRAAFQIVLTRGATYLQANGQDKT